MDLHRGPGLRHQEARPPTGSTRDGSAPGTRPPPSEEARHPTGRPPPTGGDPARWTCTGDRPPPAGGETSHGQASANRRRIRSIRYDTIYRTVRYQYRTVRYHISYGISRPRHTEARRDTPVVTHPTPTAAQDDLTPRSPIQVLPQAGTI
jgi:hypothetical protein